jgi:hypothetical protein
LIFRYIFHLKPHFMNGLLDSSTDAWFLTKKFKAGERLSMEYGHFISTTYLCRTPVFCI